MERREFFLKPLTILAMIVIFSLTLIVANKAIYIILMGTSFVLVFIMEYRALKGLVIGYLAVRILTRLIFNIFGKGHYVGAFLAVAPIILRLYPVFGLAAIMLGFNTQEILNSLRMIGVPNYMGIGVAVFFRFLPEYFSYLGQIREGAIVRGIRPSIKRPIESLETVLVPMIYKAFETGENLAAALMTKGIDYDGPKTYYRDISLGPRDWIAIGLSLLALGGSLWMR